jgi:hypothetical protein
MAINMVVGECCGLLAILFQSLFACLTMPAGIDHTADADVITGFESCDIGSNAFHAADDFMTWHDRVCRGKPTAPVIADRM